MSQLLLKIDEVAERLGIAKSTLWRLNASGKIPRPVRIGRSTRWRSDELEDWVEIGCPPREKWEIMKAKK